MTEAEMYLIGDLLYYSGKNHVVFDERANDKRLLLVSTDVPTIARYILTSPITTPVQKMFAEDGLKEYMAADNTVCAQQTRLQDDDRVLYYAPDLGQFVDSQSPDIFPPEPMELTFNDNVPAIMLKDDIVYLDRFDTEEFLPDGSPRCDYRYRAIDTYGDVEWARCTRATTVRVRVNDRDGDVYEAECCLRCAEDAVKNAGKMGHALAVEILGE